MKNHVNCWLHQLRDTESKTKKIDIYVCIYVHIYTQNEIFPNSHTWIKIIDGNRAVVAKRQYHDCTKTIIKNILN